MMGIINGVKKIVTGAGKIIGSGVATIGGSAIEALWGRSLDAPHPRVRFIMQETDEIRVGDYIIVSLRDELGITNKLIQLRRAFLKRRIELWQCGTPGPMVGVERLHSLQPDVLENVHQWYAEKYHVVTISYLPK